MAPSSDNTASDTILSGVHWRYPNEGGDCSCGGVWVSVGRDRDMRCARCGWKRNNCPRCHCESWTDRGSYLVCPGCSWVWIKQLPVKKPPAGMSPIERHFWTAHLQSRFPQLDGLVHNYPVAVNGRRYKIDFALPDDKIGIELDGFATHSSTADIAHDRQRQRALEAEGWRIIRFGGSEIHHDARHCVWQAAELAGRWAR